MSAKELAQKLRDKGLQGLGDGKGVPSEDFRNGWEDGFQQGQEFGYERGLRNVGCLIADEMRVLLCALVAAHKHGDDSAFWATVAITRTNLSLHATFSEEDWALFGAMSRKKTDLTTKEQ